MTYLLAYLVRKLWFLPWLINIGFLALSVYEVETQVFAGASGLAVLWTVLLTLVTVDLVVDVKTVVTRFREAAKEEEETAKQQPPVEDEQA